MAYDPVIKEHQEWLGFLQPVGLVVSPAALRNAQARVARNVIDAQQILLRHTREVLDDNRNPTRKLNRFSDFARDFWNWEEADLATPPDGLSTAVEEYREILRPDLAVPGARGESDWQILIQELSPSANMDKGGDADEQGWQASPQVRFERLLRGTATPIGLLVHPDAIRLVYAPKGETAGHLTFPIQAMCETAGRPIVAALHLLLDAQRLFSLPKEQRLPAILQASRKYQNEVSIQLAGQVLRALNELCRGLNEANRVSSGELLREVIAVAPEEIYGGLLTTLMRLVFLLYAEDRNLMASDEIYQNNYGVIGLHEKLREDAAAYPDTMDERPGAWAQFLTLSRLVHDGGGHGDWHLPARRGRLFDPDSYPFLEGRPHKSRRGDYEQRGEKLTPPRVADGVLNRVLEDLLYLDGERISYRALDVEQIGSVYEAMMGFAVEVARGPSIGVKPDHVVLNLQTLLDQPAADRKKWLKENAGWEPAERAAQAVKLAETVEALLTAIHTRVSPLYLDADGRSLLIAPADIYLQPTEERRRSGSHYTPRTLTEPIVRTTLDPVLAQLGENPTPEQILDLKVCDPAMGSGAFLVEACRYLGAALEKAWGLHKVTPDIPADQDPALHARRVVAQRCLYGVDKNPFAVDLAKLSLWLATFAKDHPFTFLDHSLRHGDSLVGLSFTQIVDALGDGSSLFRPLAEARVKKAMEARRSILDAVEHTAYELLETKYLLAQESVGTLRDLGDAMVAAFFLEEKPRDRDRRSRELANAFDHNQFDMVSAAIHELRVNRGIVPFHWETELPEVFERGGFDAVVGNPPFLGGRKISGAFGKPYAEFLYSQYPGAANLCDFVAYFFRLAFEFLRAGGTLGLLATKSVAKGDTRLGGLARIVGSGGVIYNATRRIDWPGEAAVIASALHIAKPPVRITTITIDGHRAEQITSFLFTSGGDSLPERLISQSDLFSQGSKIYGQGFLFDDRDEEASPLDEMRRIMSEYPDSAERIYPYIGGDETTSSPLGRPTRYVIYLSDIRTEAELAQWPALASIVRKRVKPYRDALPDTAVNRPLRRRWWAYQAHRPQFYVRARPLPRILATKEVSSHLIFVFLPSEWIYSHKLNLFLLPQNSSFAVLQGRVHEAFVRAFAASRGDGISYSCSDCFETFPFPRSWYEDETLEAIGAQYYQFRSEIALRNGEGLTAIYNRFHNKYEDDAEIQKLRELHADMDRAVLDAYGWTDLRPVHDFILDYEESAEEHDGKPHKRKEPWRYRWTDDFRDEVLARLLELNRVRAEAERQAAAAVDANRGVATRPAAAKTRKTRKKKDEKTIDMYGEQGAGE